MSSSIRDVKIKEIMKQEDLPVVERNEPMSKVVPFPEGTSHAWVVEGEGSERVVGVVTDYDVLRVVSPERPSYVLGFPDMRTLCSSCPIDNIMTTELVKTTPEETLDDALKKIVNHRISRLPVLDKDGKLVGEVHQSHVTGRVSELLVG